MQNQNLKPEIIGCRILCLQTRIAFLRSVGPVLSPSYVARYLNVSAPRVWELINQGKLKTVAENGSRLVVLSSVVDLLKARLLKTSK